MKRGIAVLISLCALAVILYFTASSWAIRHERITFLNTADNNHTVTVDTAVRRDSEIEANAGLTKLPVAIINSTVGKCEVSSSVANQLAARGSITTNQDAIRRLFGVTTDSAGNLPSMPGVFPDYPAPVIHDADAGREMIMMRWGMRPPPQAGNFPVTSIRNASSPHWRCFGSALLLRTQPKRFELPTPFRCSVA
jgi:hypothetical protein